MQLIRLGFVSALLCLAHAPFQHRRRPPCSCDAVPCSAPVLFLPLWLQFYSLCVSHKRLDLLPANRRPIRFDSRPGPSMGLSSAATKWSRSLLCLATASLSPPSTRHPLNHE
jgi:hypothetical protein